MYIPILIWSISFFSADWPMAPLAARPLSLSELGSVEEVRSVAARMLALPRDFRSLLKTLNTRDVRQEGDGFERQEGAGFESHALELSLQTLAEMDAARASPELRCLCEVLGNEIDAAGARGAALTRVATQAHAAIFIHRRLERMEAFDSLGWERIDRGRGTKLGGGAGQLGGGPRQLGGCQNLGGGAKKLEGGWSDRWVRGGACGGSEGDSGAPVAPAGAATAAATAPATAPATAATTVAATAAATAFSPAVPRWESLLAPALFAFDARRYDFARLALEMLEPILGTKRAGESPSAKKAGKGPSPHVALSQLHLSAAGRAELGYARVGISRMLLGDELGGHGPGGGDDPLRKEREARRKAYDEATRYGCNAFNRAFKASPLRDAFLKLYDELIQQEILPTLGCDQVLYQAVPVFRVFLPCHLAVGPKHRDEAYHAQPNEINFWLPLTDAFDSNSLYVESSRGSRDYAALECGYGSYARFHGNSCEHFTELNLTGRTRVSLDFRVVRDVEFGVCPVAESGDEQGGKGKEGYFTVGRYYKRCRRAE